MTEFKNKVEAVLFTTGRFMDIEEIAKLCGEDSIGFINEALKELIEDYNKRESALHITEQNNKYKLNIKKDYNYLTTKLLSSTEFDAPTQQTLALIAYKQPVIQSDIVKMRGNNAYDHIKILRESEFITTEKYGRTRMIKLSPKFYDYFDVVEGQLQENFEDVENKVLKDEVQKTLKVDGIKIEELSDDSQLDPEPEQPVDEPKGDLKDNSKKQGEASFMVVEKYMKEDDESETEN